MRRLVCRATFLLETSRGTRARARLSALSRGETRRSRSGRKKTREHTILAVHGDGFRNASEGLAGYTQRRGGGALVTLATARKPLSAVPRGGLCDSGGWSFLVGVEAAVGQRQGRLGEGGQAWGPRSRRERRPGPSGRPLHSGPHSRSPRSARARFRVVPRAPSAGRSCACATRSGALLAVETPRLSRVPGVYYLSGEWRSIRGVGTGRVLEVERLGQGFWGRAAWELGRFGIGSQKDEVFANGAPIGIACESRSFVFVREGKLEGKFSRATRRDAFEVGFFSTVGSIRNLRRKANEICICSWVRLTAGTVFLLPSSLFSY